MNKLKFRHFLNTVVLLLIFLLNLQESMAQKIVDDSLNQYSLVDLQKKFIKYYSESYLNQKYAHAYLKKAIILKDSFEIAEGYYMLTLTDRKNKLSLYDSIIRVTKNFKNQKYPSIAYLDKGIHFYNKSRYTEALENYLLAKKNNTGSDRVWLNFLINKNIGSLKLRIDENEEALKIFEESWEYLLKNDFKNKESHRYLEGLFDLSNALRKTNRIDSARTYTRIGVIQSKKSKNNKYFNFFNMLEGILEISSNPNISLNKLHKSKDYFKKENDSLNIAIAYQYLGKTYSNIGQYDKALDSFEEVDNYISNDSKILPELLYSYKILSENSAKLNDSKKELYYVNKIISFDSIFKSDYKNINTKIKREYDIPLLLETRDSLISKLENDNTKNRSVLWVSLSIIIFITSLLINQFRLRKKFQKRFDFLINQKELSNKKVEKVLSLSNKNKLDELNISESIVNKIIQDINKIKENNLFLSHSINTNSLAKELGTNNSYYSKVFKSYIGISFSQYIKELRVEYAFKKLKDDRTFRKYTIRAIALDSGFKNPESFSKSFYQIYKIYPSLLIKKLNKQKA